MTTTHTTTGKTGAKRASWSKANPRDLMLKIRKANPDADVQQMFACLLEEMEKPRNKKYQRGIYEHFNANSYRSLVHDEKENESGEDKDKAKAAAAAAAKDIMKTAMDIELMTFLMPNGKELGDCTGPELRVFSGWASRLADKIGNHTVREILNEHQLHEALNAQ